MVIDNSDAIYYVIKLFLFKFGFNILSIVVNKELLQTPEDEIDPQKVPMKDLILLAEYKERLAV